MKTRVGVRGERKVERNRDEAAARTVPLSAFVFFPAAASTRGVVGIGIGIGIGIAFPPRGGGGGGGGGLVVAPPRFRCIGFIVAARRFLLRLLPGARQRDRHAILRQTHLADAPRHRVPCAFLLRDGPFEVAPALPPRQRRVHRVKRDVYRFDVPLDELGVERGGRDLLREARDAPGLVELDLLGAF